MHCIDFDLIVAVCGSHGEVRLVNGYLPSEGHAEVCLDGVWVGACGIGWDNVDAAVVCRQLGYSSAGEMKL